MTWIIKSEKAKKSITTKDPLKDEAWGNAYYGTDDCVRVEVVDPTKEEQESADRLREEIYLNKSFLDATDYKIIKKLESLLPKDDVDVVARQAKRVRLNELGV
jgi:hypothetical protein